MEAFVLAQPVQLFLIFSDVAAFPPSLHREVSQVLFAWCLFIQGPGDSQQFESPCKFHVFVFKVEI